METGVPDPWERYRALTDVLDTFNDISEMADRKTRFALVILGAMNTVNLLVVARPELFLGERTAKDPALLTFDDLREAARKKGGVEWAGEAAPSSKELFPDVPQDLKHDHDHGHGHDHKTRRMRS